MIRDGSKVLETAEQHERKNFVPYHGLATTPVLECLLNLL